MTRVKQSVLMINSGLSSKFVLYESGTPMQPGLTGKIHRIGLPWTPLVFTDTIENQQDSLNIDAGDYRSAANLQIDWLEQRVEPCS